MDNVSKYPGAGSLGVVSKVQEVYTSILPPVTHSSLDG
jgi:hypothetical protein